MHAVAEGQVRPWLAAEVEPVGVREPAGSRLAAGTESTTGSPARIGPAAQLDVLRGDPRPARTG